MYRPAPGGLGGGMPMPEPSESPREPERVAEPRSPGFYLFLGAAIALLLALGILALFGPVQTQVITIQAMPR